MSALGQKQTFRGAIAIFALSPKADIDWLIRSPRRVQSAAQEPPHPKFQQEADSIGRPVGDNIRQQALACFQCLLYVSDTWCEMP